VYYFRMVAETGSQKHTSHGLQFTSGVEVIVDDPQAVLVGTWNTGAFGVPFGPSYRWADVIIASQPTRTATFRPNLTVAGRYDVHVWYTPGGNRTTAARYDIRHRTGTSLITQSQRTGGNSWTLLSPGMFFDQGTNGYAQVRNDSTVGTVVIADAFRWLLQTADPLPAGEPPGWWRRHFFGETSPPGHIDADDDGFSLYEEYMWGTVPNDPASHPKTRFERAPDGTLRFSFSPMRSDRVYRIERSAGLDGWTLLGLAAREENGTGVFDLSMGGERGFYRLRVSLP
jgi:hypothetical protein